MKNQTIMNRKSAKKLLMVQWSRFQNVCIELEGSTLRYLPIYDRCQRKRKIDGT